MSSEWTEPSDAERAESPVAVQQYMIDLESEHAALMDDVAEMKRAIRELINSAQQSNTSEWRVGGREIYKLSVMAPTTPEDT